MSLGLACAIVALAATLSSQPDGVGKEPKQESAPEIVRTEDYEVHLSPRGGVPIRWDIVTSPQDGRIGLIDPELWESGIPRALEVVLPGTSDLNSALHRVERFEEGDKIVVRFLSAATPTGLRWIRTYKIPQRGFESELSVTLINDGTSVLRFDDGAEVGLRLGPGLDVESVSTGGLGGGLYTYVRPIYKSAGEVDVPRLSQEDPDQVFNDSAGGIAWGGIHSRYFAAVLAPKSSAREAGRFHAGRAWLSSQLAEEDVLPGEDFVLRPLVELYEKPFSIAPGEFVELSYTLFFGPKERRILESMQLGLEQILFPSLWNWLRWLCFILMSMLSGFHAILQSWGLSIIALAVAIRIITFPVSHIGLKHQAAMTADQARLKPFIAEINEKYKDDAARQSRELMRLYKEHGVNPFAAFKGCLWVLIQLPIFVALFNLLGQAFELRGARFLWLRDLSEPDRLFPLGADLPLVGSYFNVLPFLMAATQVLVTKLSSVPADPSADAKQNYFMLAIAVLFLLLFYSFPSGLVLYWTVANLGHLVQYKLMVWREARKAKV